MPLSQGDVVELARRLMTAFKKELDSLNRIDKWWRWDHDPPHQPRHSTKEYKELSARAQSPWLGLVVTSVAQALYVDGYRRADQPEDAAAWDWWQANGMDARQVPLHRAALGYGHAYLTVLPGNDGLTGDVMPEMRGYSPRRMLAFYAEPEHDDWPLYALRAEPRSTPTKGWDLRLYDDEAIYFLDAESLGDKITYIEHREHDLDVCPVVRYTNQLDLEGRTPGEVEPYIAVAGRIDQTTFDRLVVQRFSSWVVRTIAGMAKPDTPEEEAAARLKLKVEDLLIAEEKDTKFGSLPASPLDGFITAAEADIRVLAAVSQTPAHELLAQLVNLSAEALAAARANRAAKVEERQKGLGESHEQTLRLAAWVMGDEDGARDRKAQVRWRDTEVRSLAQAADALGKLAKMLAVPAEILWEKIPGWTQQDVERAKALASETDSISELAALLDRQAADSGVGQD